jgi:RND superfamily putative drug exporter
VVISAAAVMIAVFLAFTFAGPLALREMGVILALAVILDALVVRLVLLSILLRLGRHNNWHQPKWLGKVPPKVRLSYAREVGDHQEVP